MTGVSLTRRWLIATSMAGLSGCGFLPEEQESVEASASQPAYLPASAASEAGYTAAVESKTTVETTVRIDLLGDVEMTNSRKAIATVFRRAYAADDGRRFGLVTAPAVEVYKQPEIIRDPVTALEPARVVELATDASVEGVSEWSKDGTATMLDTEVTLRTATATGESGEVVLDRLRVRVGEDSVTAMVLTPEGTDRSAPFEAVKRDG
ncbi:MULTISPECIES: DUF6517 family protein [unclassified Haloparvum]|uniref:DUF6517 family protein n=1 Tax=Haloparvum sp. PAK95 TaxID=3418962 RepID=UPI003D2EF836